MPDIKHISFLLFGPHPTVHRGEGLGNVQCQGLKLGFLHVKHVLHSLEPGYARFQKAETGGHVLSATKLQIPLGAESNHFCLIYFKNKRLATQKSPPGLYLSEKEKGYKDKVKQLLSDTGKALPLPQSQSSCCSKNPSIAPSMNTRRACLLGQALICLGLPYWNLKY